MDIKQARAKAQAIVSEMTVEEKMSQLVYGSPAIERLGIHEYNWWNEAAHGVARAGIATVFPHAISMAASFNPKLAKLVGEVVSTEARAKYNKSIEFGDRDIYKGLTYWAPNINIFRDPRWGRGQETYGECPCLTTLMGTAYIKGLQGEGEFLKAAACAKHFAVIIRLVVINAVAVAAGKILSINCISRQYSTLCDSAVIFIFYFKRNIAHTIS